MFKEQISERSKQKKEADVPQSSKDAKDGQQTTSSGKTGTEKQLVRSSDDDNNSKMSTESEEEDIFMKAVDIAVTAQRARLKYEEVKRKVRFIEDLAKRAKEESHSLQEVAASLASTATAVATVALQVCSYGSYNEAFASKIGYSKKIDLNTFMGIVSPQRRESDNSVEEEEESLESFYSDYRTPGPTHVRQRRHSMDDHLYLPQSQDKQKLGKLKTLKTPLIPPYQSSRGIPQGYTSKSRRSSGGSVEELEIPSSTSSEKFVEKFPRQLLPDEYKESLEVPFNQIESESSMTPLWEDRYVSMEQGGKVKVGVSGLATSQTLALGEPSWTEKKSMKQFQMKIQQACPETSDQDILASDRPDNPTPPPLEDDEEDDDDGEDNILDRRSDGSVPETSSIYISQYDVDYDAEVANLLGPKELNRLRDTEQCQPGLLRPPPTLRPEQRPISPLLNDKEKNKCGRIRENGTVSPKQEKQTFKLAQARQEKKE